MNTIQSTLYNSGLLTTLLKGGELTVVPNTTVNERLSINATAQLGEGELPHLGYLLIGNGGHENATGTNGFPLQVPNDHLATHASLFNPIPVCMRKTDNDLTPAQRAKYALRSEMTVEGENYYAYWAYRRDFSQYPVQYKKTTVVDGVANTELFVPGTNELYPQKIGLPNAGAISTSGVTVSASVTVSIDLSAEDIAELVNVAVTLYGDEQYAIISEFAFASGVDRVFSVPSTNGQVNFNDVVACQVMAYMNEIKNLPYNLQRLAFDVEMGAATPLLATQSIPTVTTIGT